MSWEDQGRQYHMWFGHGKAAAKNGSSGNGTAGTANKDIVKIATTLAYGAVAALPRSQRVRAEAQLHEGTLDRLTKVLPIWISNAHLDADTFAERFLGRDADDPVAANLHAAVIDISSAPDQSFLGGAREKFANAMKAMGVDQWARSFAQTLDRADKVATPPGFSDHSPVPFKDDKGNVIKSGDIPMMRPAGMDPHFFVDQGLKDKRTENTLLSAGRPITVAAGLGLEVVKLAHFIQTGAWDAQRLGSRNYKEFVDYASVAIGLYAAANGISKGVILQIQNQYARVMSHYDPQEKMDKTYIYLPAKNVANTDLGYRLYQSGRIAGTRSKQ